MPKRTHKRNRKKRKRTHGFRARMSSSSGQKIIKHRRRKSREKLST